MPRHTFLTIPVGNCVGLTSVSIGLVRTFDRLGAPVGFFKALSQPHAGEDFDRSSAYLEVTNTLEPSAAISYERVKDATASGRLDDLMEEVISHFEKIPAEQESIIVEGLVATPDLPNAQAINAALARALNAEVILVTRPHENGPEALIRQLNEILNTLPPAILEVRPAVVLNHVNLPALRKRLNLELATAHQALLALQEEISSDHLPYDLIGLVPSSPDLAATRVADIVSQLDGRIIFPGDMKSRRIREITLCARTVPNMLGALKTGTLIVTPSDRSDIITAAALAATRSIQLAGLILTGGCKPDEATIAFCRDAFALDGGLPVIQVESSSYETARSLFNLNPELPVEDIERVNLVMETVALGMDTSWLRKRCSTTVEKRLSPPAFRHRVTTIARRSPKRIILPEGEEPRTIQAAIRCAERSIAICQLIGDPAQIAEVARVNNLSLHPEVGIIDPATVRDRYLEPLLERRRHKGMTEKDAVESLRDNTVLGTIMLELGEVDGLVAGAVQSTANTIRPALQLIKTRPDARAVSSVFFMCLPDQVLVYGDCAVNPDPDAELLADIAIQSAASAKAFGIEPVIAMISYSTLGSGSGSNVDKVKEATEIVRQRDPSLVIDGPLQYDAASIREVARTKAPDSKVAGRANVFIFPDLNTGNTTYKAVQRSANVVSMGPMLQGLRKPVNDLSRGASVDDILYTIALTAVQAGQTSVS
ncbi:phosphate acetyltransferase [Haloferula chungangensis]|uniref:Phosphate acetyltransferase n=1 Tax=Haloferula chungangensis TaxID=1048331 RepID=A0ABW2LCH1_9BACT